MSLISEAQLTEELSIGKRRIQPVEDDLDKLLTLVHAHAQNVIRMSNSGKALVIQLNRLPNFLTAALDQNSVRATEMAHVQSNKLVLQQQHTMYDNVVLDFTTFRSKIFKMKSDVEQLLKARPVVHTLEIKVQRARDDRAKRRSRGEYLSAREEQTLKDNEIVFDRQLKGFNGMRENVLAQIDGICTAGQALAAKVYTDFLQSQMDVANALAIQAASSLSLSRELGKEPQSEAKSAEKAPVVAWGSTVAWGPGATPTNTPAQEECVLVGSPTTPESSFNFISPSPSSVDNAPDLLSFDAVELARQPSDDPDSLAELFLQRSKSEEEPAALPEAPVVRVFTKPLVQAPILVSTTKPPAKPKDAFADLLDL